MSEPSLVSRRDQHVVALHPESTDDPATLRWVAPRTPMPFVGPLASARGLDGLAPGLVTRVVVAPDALVVTLAPGASWRAEGAGVRHALVEALEHPDAWVAGPDAHDLGPDDVLRLSAAELIDGPIGDIARSHGGSIELVDARDDVVSVRLRGACQGCPAAVITMHQRLENQLRRRVPSLRAVEQV